MQRSAQLVNVKYLSTVVPHIYGEMPGQKELTIVAVCIRVYSRITSIENEWIFNTLIIIILLLMRHNNNIYTQKYNKSVRWWH